MTAASSAAPYCVLPDTVVNEQHYTNESPDQSRDRGPGDCLPRGLGGLGCLAPQATVSSNPGGSLVNRSRAGQIHRRAG